MKFIRPSSYNVWSVTTYEEAFLRVGSIIYLNHNSVILTFYFMIINYYCGTEDPSSMYDTIL